MSLGVGDQVFVPNALVGRPGRIAAIDRFEVAEVGAGAPTQQRSVRVILSPDEDPDDGWVATSRVHEELGISLIRIGDLTTETGLLDPLVRSLTHYLRLLVGDDYFRSAYLRTLAEFTQFWRMNRPGTTHLVLVGHGRRDAIRFLGEDAPAFANWMAGANFAELLGAHEPGPKINVLSLCCETGYADFSKVVSQGAAIRTCAGPMRDLHGAVASQFAQTVFAEHLLEGRTWPTSFRLARGAAPGIGNFRLWRDGTLVQGAMR